MGFSIKNLLNQATAQVYPFDNGATAATVRKQQSLPPARPPVKNAPAPSIIHQLTHNPVTNAIGRAPQNFINDVSVPVERAVTKTAFGRGLETVGLGALRSGIGTAQAASGLYDLATKGTGTNRFSKGLDTTAKQVDQTAKEQNKVLYKGSQLGSDLLTLGAGGKVLKGASEVPKVSKILAPATKLVSGFEKTVAGKTAGLATKGFTGRVTAKAIQNAAKPSYQVANAGFTAMQTGKEASQGKQVTPQSVATNLAIGGVGFPVAGAVSHEVAAPVINKAVTGLRNAKIIAPSKLNPAEVTHLSDFMNARGTNAMTQDVYDNGIRAAQKAKVDVNNPTQVDQLLGAHKSYETAKLNRRQVLQSLKPQPLNNAGGARQFDVGTRIRANDRGNIGTVVAVNQDGSAQVRFFNRKDKTTFTKTMQPHEFNVTGSKGARQTSGNQPVQSYRQAAQRGKQGQAPQTPLETQQLPVEQPTTHVGQNDVPTNNQPTQGKSKVETLQGSKTLQERGFIQTVLDDPNTSPEIKNSISSLYATRNTKQAQTKAANLVKEHRDIAEQIAANPHDDTSIFIGNELVKQLQHEGNYEHATELVQKMAEALTASGRMSQAASAYGKLTPEGIIRFAQKELDKYNTQSGVKVNKQIKLTPAQHKDLVAKASEIQKMPEGRAKDVAIKEMMKAVYELVPSTWVKKVSTLQTIAQLLNPKTIIRNVVGNSIFGGVEVASQTVAAGIDKAVSAILGSERTTALPQFKAAAQGAKRGAKEAYQEATKGINLGPATQFELNDVPAFRGKLLGSLEKSMGVVLRVPDRAAYQAAFDDTVAGLMKANKLDKPTLSILEQAHANGVYRTFQDNSKAAQLFSGLKQALNHVGVEKNGTTFGLGDLILKYPKTPGNILARGIDYSPLGILKGLKTLTDTAFSGKPFDQHTFVNSVARSGVGTAGLIGTGAVLGALGIITEKPSTDTDTRNLQKQVGQGGYQINTSALKRFVTSGFDKSTAQIRPGDQLVTYDWAQPLSIPLSAGAAIGKGQSAKDGAISTLSGASEGINTLIEQPLVTGVNTFATNIKNKGIVGALGETVKGAPASFVPTASNQARQLTDNTTRSSYDPNAFKQSLNMVLNKIPGADRKLNPQIDTLGGVKQNYQNGSNNIFNVAANPAFVTNYQPTSAAELPLNIYNQTGDTQQMPRTVKTSVTINGKTVPLTANQYRDYQAYVGTKTKEAYNALSQDPTFMALTPSEQAKVMSNQMTDINDAAKVYLFGGTNDLTKRATAVLNGQTVTAPIKGATPAKSTDPKVAYQQALTDYKTKKASGKLTSVEDLKAQQSLAKQAITSNFSTDVQQFYGLSKENMNTMFKTDPENAKKLYDQAKQLDAQLLASGQISTSKFKNGLATKGKSGGSKKVSLGKYSKYALGSTASTSNSKLLRNLVKNASIKSSSSRKVSSKKVALKKYTPKAAKVARKTSYMV